MVFKIDAFVSSGQQGQPGRVGPVTTNVLRLRKWVSNLPQAYYQGILDSRKKIQKRFEPQFGRILLKLKKDLPPKGALAGYLKDPWDLVVEDSGKRQTYVGIRFGKKPTALDVKAVPKAGTPGYRELPAGKRTKTVPRRTRKHAKTFRELFAIIDQGVKGGIDIVPKDAKALRIFLEGFSNAKTVSSVREFQQRRRRTRTSFEVSGGVTVNPLSGRVTGSTLKATKTVETDVLTRTRSRRNRRIKEVKVDRQGQTFLLKRVRQGKVKPNKALRTALSSGRKTFERMFAAYEKEIRKWIENFKKGGSTK